MTNDIRHLSERLAAHVEDVCAYYLSNGRRNGRYWLVGDVRNTPGRSLFVRLAGPLSGRGAAGRWTDAATGEHGDLLDMIRLNRNLASFSDVKREAMTFLSEPVRLAKPSQTPAPRNSPEAARRLFAASTPIVSTVAETYLRGRGITAPLDEPALRFHPRCFIRVHGHSEPMACPALIAGITNLDGEIRAVLRTYLDRHGSGKAPIIEPRRALGDVLGNGIRLGRAHDVMAAGEGLETMLALKSIIPSMPMVSALTANHLAALILPSSLARLYIAHDNGHAGRAAAETLALRSIQSGIDVRLLTPRTGDWNSDLTSFDVEAVRADVLMQLDPEDVIRFGAPVRLR